MALKTDVRCDVVDLREATGYQLERLVDMDKCCFFGESGSRPAFVNGIAVLASLPDRRYNYAGFVVGQRQRRHEYKFVIQRIGVSKHFRQQGIGLHLLKTLAKHLKAQGCTTIETYIARHNVASLKLFLAAGYQMDPNNHCRRKWWIVRKYL